MCDVLIHFCNKILLNKEKLKYSISKKNLSLFIVTFQSLETKFEWIMDCRFDQKGYGFLGLKYSYAFDLPQKGDIQFPLFH